MSAVIAALWGRLLCRLGFHQIQYEWKTKHPYCARSRPCKATDSFMRRLTRWARDDRHMPHMQLGKPQLHAQGWAEKAADKHQGIYHKNQTNIISIKAAGE